MKKILIFFGISVIAIVIFINYEKIFATDSSGQEVSCTAKHILINTDGTCKCKNPFIWNEKKQDCTNSIVYCSDTYAQRSIYDKTTKNCKCRDDFELNSTGKLCVKKKYTEVTLDDSDPSNGSAQYDFELAEKTVYGSPDIFIAGMIFENSWMPALDWQIVEIQEDNLDNVKECPAEGYASLDDPDGDGWGSPRYAYEGHVYCLKTAEGNYVKLQITYARYEWDTELRVLKFKYYLQKDGSRFME